MELQRQVAQAVHILNHDLSSSNRVAANQWLVQFQRSDAAWEVAASILTSESSHIHEYEVELFAAQILKRKIQSDISMLQPDGRNALQNALLMAAKNFSLGFSQLLTQICLALSALVLRASESKPIEQLFISLNELQHQGTGKNAVLELLTVLPEEVMEDRNMNTSVNQDRRWQFSQDLLSKTPSVLEFLLHLSKNGGMENSELHEKERKILRCLLSWVRIGCFFEVPQENLPNHPLLGFICSALQVPLTFDVAVEVLAELVSRHESLPSVILPRILIVKDLLLLQALGNGNESVIKGLTWLMAELGQAAPSLIAQASPEAFSFTDALLRCVAFQSPSFEIPESTLQFWSTLAEHLLSMDDFQAEHQKQRYLAPYVSIYITLLDDLVLRAQVASLDFAEDDLDRNSGLPDDLALFRVNLEEPLISICRLLGPSQFLSKLLPRAWHPFDLSISWQVVEARLFALYTVHKSLAQVVGSFSKWICNYQTAVFPLLSFLASGLTKPVAANACATALRKICEDVTYLTSEPANFDCIMWIGEGLQKLEISLLEEAEVVCGISRVLSTLNNSASLNDALQRLLKSSYESIESLLNLESGSDESLKLYTSAYAAAHRDCIRALHRLGTYINELSGPGFPATIGEESFLRVLAHFWPLLERLFVSQHMQDSDLAVAACKALTQAIKAGGGHFSSLLPNVMTAASSNFFSFQTHVCFIKLATVTIEEFGHEKNCGPLFIDTFRLFTAAEATSSLNSSYACDQEPDLAEAYMNFTSTFIRSCPEEVVAAADFLLEASLSKASICCTVMHRGAALAAMSYISCFLEAALSSLYNSSICLSDASLATSTLKICSRSGENIISGMFYALLGVSAMTRVHKVATILQQLAAICDICEKAEWKAPIGWTSLQSWLISSVRALPSEYLRQGEAEILTATWLKFLKAAASDIYKTRLISSSRAGSGYMQGDGGRSLKRILREFADGHRFVSPFVGC
ncbi:hypothetical protein O6H91_14G069600 [Diphasiastrum complanatum]|uniref:Uncharacterized protein n=1 Tax=Diphasiastrum complanatum TaxID=34168 RepID=A0ACC2BQJ5_DIPCM|nr:hypothetical protein O6H91_14G069600 [Diphasiastrum complanatum]